MTAGRVGACLLDTSALILLERLDEAELPAEPLITSVTLPGEFEGIAGLELRGIGHPGL